MEEDINKIDADIYNKFLEDRMIFGFTFDELIELRKVMNKYEIKVIKKPDGTDGDGTKASVIDLIDFGWCEGCLG